MEQAQFGHSREGTVPRLSVVIPHLNEPGDLRRCLEALDAQKRDGVPFEVIVVDNGSHQSPASICSTLANVRLVHERTPGPGPARSLGARIARANIIAFIDADCVAEAGWVREIVEYFDRNLDVDIIAGDIDVLRSDVRKATAIESYEGVFSYRVPLFVRRDHYAATGNMSVRADRFRKVGPFGGITIAEDRDWGRRATAKGFRLSYVPQIRVLTPACQTFSELAGRWDRAIAHDFQDFLDKGVGTARWVARSLAVAVSPIIDLREILQSNRISGLRERFFAFVYLVRIRFYRAKKMLILAFQRNSLPLVASWNRPQKKG